MLANKFKEFIYPWYADDVGATDKWFDAVSQFPISRREGNDREDVLIFRDGSRLTFLKVDGRWILQ